MDMTVIRRLFFPPTVLALLAMLFEAFGVFDTLFAVDEEPAPVVAIARPVVAPLPSQLRHGLDSLPTPSSPFALAAAPPANPTAAPDAVAIVPITRSNGANDPAIREDAGRTGNQSVLPPIPPLASNSVYVQHQPLPEVISEPISEASEVPPLEMAQLGDIPAVEEPIEEQFVPESPVPSASN